MDQAISMAGAALNLAFENSIQKPRTMEEYSAHRTGLKQKLRSMQ